MSFRFDIKKSTNILLFTIHSLGGNADMYKVFSILYQADLKHLCRYGTPILGDSYIAMKQGSVPFNILNIYKQVKGESYFTNSGNYFKDYFRITDEHKIVSLTKYNEEYLSETEVGCLFESIHQNKNKDHEALNTNDIAWHMADANGEIALESLILACGATPEMAAYIKEAYDNELNSFNEDNEA